MKKLTKILSLFLVFALTLSCIPAAFAAEVDDAVINPDAACSLTVFKFDWTNAVKDGVWNQDSFISNINNCIYIVWNAVFNNFIKR